MDQKTAYDVLKLGKNIYLTGPAGSGKTYLLNKYIKYLKGKGVSVGVTASTGIAATHMGGVTIHSWSGLGIKDSLNTKDLKDLLKKRHLIKRFNSVKVLIIDEISMLHAVQLDMVDRICREFKGLDMPFGGIQVIMCGDFFQLPPVSKSREKSQFVSASNIWNSMDLQVCYLDEQHRQDDKKLTKILNSIRANKCDHKLLDSLQVEKDSEFSDVSDATKLYTHNVDVDGINGRALQDIFGKAYAYTMRHTGKDALADTLKKGCLAPEKLLLKKGARVMFIKNNFEQGYVNGTLGHVINFSAEGFPIVETVSGQKIIAAPVSWIIEDEGAIKAEIVQIPLRLAWAITVHKSQGMSLDSAEIDLGKSFIQGMGYVALSRVRTLSGIKLLGINEMALKVDEDVIELDQELISMSELARDNIRAMSSNLVSQSQLDFLCSISPTEEEKKKRVKKVPGITYFETKELVKKKLLIKEIANRRGMVESTIFGHLEKLLAQGEKLDLEYMRPEKKQFNEIKKAFEASEGMSLSPVREILGDSFSYDELRVVRLFL
jgi:hypothetical protein